MKDKATRKWLKKWEEKIDLEYVIKCGPILDSVGFNRPAWKVEMASTAYEKMRPDPSGPDALDLGERMEHDA